ncbi:MAG: hypothetical protein QY330_01525 [Candidatus Dojkabacteria bacterium]|uniref:Uncharacterized protein n=1 Tax=candidate division WS6 bacterium OLB21 TaxID=1617427 RepID=A0A136KJ81_9BACT|nr:MAG: hypothetical protein UZ20_WS6002000519 [candidate division WS6 bacterium OLB21]WKZ28269.1 MAG: hypothetical protein QY330_01525 [Candidatus Dojkabacteria bacterium]
MKKKISVYNPILHTRSILFGIIAGFTLTAVMVSVQSFVGFQDLHSSFSLKANVLDSLQRYFDQPVDKLDSNSNYPSLEDILAVDTSGWTVFKDEQYQITFRHPEKWNVSVSGTKECASGQTDDCYTIVLAENGSNTAVVVSTSSNYIPLQQVIRRPIVGYLSGNEVVLSQYYPATCSFDAMGKEMCVIADNAVVQFTTSATADADYFVYITGKVNSISAAIINSLRMNN